MDLLGKFGGLVEVEKTTKSQARSFEEIVSDTIDEQIRIANGEKVYGTKPKKGTTEYPLKKSWRSKDGTVKIKIGIKTLFDGQALKMSEEQYKSFLPELKDNWTEDPNIHAEMMKVKKSIEETNKKRDEARKSNKS